MLRPASLVVVGASRRRGTVGGECLHNLLVGRYPGDLYVVNPNADEVQGVRAYASVAELPAPVELAVIAVPAVAALAAAHPEIAELDCNPLIAGHTGAVVVDARVRIAPPPPPHQFGAVNT